MAWKVDPQKSRIEFVAKHVNIQKVPGRFSSFEGTIDINETDPQASQVQGTVDVASVRTPISLRDKNLRSKFFFDVKRFPVMSFRSTRVGPFEGQNFKVYGDLTIKDVTRPVVFDVVNKGELPTLQGKRRWAFGASITVSRKEFGLKWTGLFTLIGVLVTDEVTGTAEIQAVQE